MAQHTRGRLNPTKTGFEDEEGANVGADVDFKFSDGDSLIHRAAIEGSTCTVANLLDHGADVNVEGFRGYTPLQYAAKHGHLGLVKLLLESGADVNLANAWDWTPLHHAAYYDRRKVIEVLLDAGSDHSAIDNVYGWTPLRWAKNNQRVINLMKRRGIKI